MKEIRDIKIDLLTGNKNPIVDLFNEITKDIMIIKCDVYHKHGLEFIYSKGDQWIFYQNCQKDEFWCNYTKYWSFFESNLRLEYQEIQTITKYLVEEALKREVGTPTSGFYLPRLLVEEALKREVGTPYWFYKISSIPVEEALKREVGTPNNSIGFSLSLVEEALKREVGTPLNDSRCLLGWVEEALKREVGTPRYDVNDVYGTVEEALKREINQNE